MNLKQLATALAVVVPLAGFSATQITGSFNEASDLTAVYLVYGNQIGSNYAFQVDQLVDSSHVVSAGTTYNFSVTDTAAIAASFFTVVGVTQSAGQNVGVELGANNTAVANLLGQSWPLTNWGVSQSQFQSDLLTNNTAGILLAINTTQNTQQLTADVSVLMNSAGGILNYSAATLAGGLQADSAPVPEPLSCLGLIGGIGVLLRRRSR